VYITHGHGDHWFGLSVILDRFPKARAFALPEVIEQMQQDSSAGWLTTCAAG
jgi:glyoxylase-like metal-dependent hydrolase (beta-lactamase superfamily II)